MKQRIDKLVQFLRSSWISALILFAPIVLIMGMGVAYQNTRTLGFGDFSGIAELYKDADGTTIRLFDLTANITPPDWLMQIFKQLYVLISPIFRQIMNFIIDLPKLILNGMEYWL